MSALISHDLHPPPTPLFFADADADGLVRPYLDHEQSVFSAVWCAADAWIFASVSLDGKAVINHVPSSEKYKILL